MTRVFRRAATAHATRVPSRFAKPRHRKHKIIMESITQEKKKLRSVISFEAKAPPGYTFIPAGNPQLTNACKETCRKDGLKVYAVTTTPHQRMHDLSQHVHRIGYHFPSVIVATACMDLGLYLTASGKVMRFQDVDNNGYTRRANSEVSQTTINTEARDAIRDLFPNIPEKDLNQIIKTAFQKGQRKVGTAVELPLARRAQLAVVAHIRHVYTNYDRLLKMTSFQDARSLVEEPTLAKLVEWRGDDENGKTVLEDVFREVIVISDDEDSDAEHEHHPTRADRDSSAELVSRNAFVGELQMRPVNYANLSPRGSLRDLSDDDAPPGFRFVPEVPKRIKPGNVKIDRRGFNRYQAWDRARDRYRERAFATRQATVHGQPVDDPRLSYTGQRPLHGQDNRVPGIIDRIHGPKVDVARRNAAAPCDGASQGHVTHPDSLSRQADTIRISAMHHPPHEPGASQRHIPGILQSSNGTVLERVVVPPRQEVLPRPLDSSNVPSFLNGPEIGRFQRPSGARVSYCDRIETNPQDHVLPSIEFPQSPASATKPPEGDIIGHFPKRASHGLPTRPLTALRQPVEELTRKVDVIDLTSSRDMTSKRRRLECHEPAHDFSRRKYFPRDGHLSTPTRDIPLLLPESGRRAVPDNDCIGNQHLAAGNRHRTLGRQPDRIPVGGVSSPLPVHPKSDIVRLFDSECANRQGVPIPTYRTAYGIYSSRKSPIRSPSGTSYALRQGEGSSRPDHAPNLAGSYLHRLYHKDYAFTDMGGAMPLEETGQRVSVRRAETNGRPYLLHDNPKSKDIYSPDFVRPVSLYDPGAPYRVAHHGPSPNKQIEHAHASRARCVPILRSQEEDRLSKRMVSGFNPHRSPSPPLVYLNSQVPRHTHNGTKVAQDGTSLSTSRHAPSAVSQYEARHDGAMDHTRHAPMYRRSSRTAERSLPAYLERVGQSYPYRHIPRDENAIILTD